MAWQEIVNLAPIRYRKAMSAAGGPIQRVTYQEELMVAGLRVYEAYAFRRPECQYGNIEKDFRLYGHCDGSGTDVHLSIAHYKAVSEALERWAFDYCCNDKKLSVAYGFDLEPSTTGMAAFPGLFQASARPAAIYEAIERWALSAWWEGFIASIVLPMPLYPSISRYRLIFPGNRCAVIIVHAFLDDVKSHVYGFACSNSIEGATFKALVEMERNARVMRNPNSKQIRQGDLNLIPIKAERRLVHFSRQEGFAAFDDRMKISARLKKNAAAPQLIVDSPLRGPWSPYSFVWRALYQPVSDRETNEDYNYFMF